TPHILPFLSEEITRSHEVKPHSHPYMAFIASLGNKGCCGGFLVKDNFVLTAAHYRGSSMKVTLGAHDIKIKEETQQIFPVTKVIPHLDFNPEHITNDIMLLKLERKAKRTEAVRPLSLPRCKVHVNPRNVCSLAGWGKDGLKRHLYKYTTRGVADSTEGPGV
ncbi:hypothetical protein U0070_006215, partial [Myodes glareolus]